MAVDGDLFDDHLLDGDRWLSGLSGGKQRPNQHLLKVNQDIA